MRLKRVLKCAAMTCLLTVPILPSSVRAEDDWGLKQQKDLPRRTSK